MSANPFPDPATHVGYTMFYDGSAWVSDGNQWIRTVALIPGQNPVNIVGKQAAATKSACECGAKALGVADYKKGHSAWCPVRET